MDYLVIVQQQEIRFQDLVRRVTELERIIMRIDSPLHEKTSPKQEEKNKLVSWLMAIHFIREEAISLQRKFQSQKITRLQDLIVHPNTTQLFKEMGLSEDQIGKFAGRVIAPGIS